MRDELPTVVEKTSAGELTVAPAKLQALKKRAAAITSGEELYALVMAIVKLGVVLAEKKKAPQVAQTLFQWVNELTPKLKKLAKADGAKMLAQAERAMKEATKIIRETNAANAAKGLAPKVKSGVGIRKK